MNDFQLWWMLLASLIYITAGAGGILLAKRKKEPVELGSWLFLSFGLTGLLSLNS